MLFYIFKKTKANNALVCLPILYDHLTRFVALSLMSIHSHEDQKYIFWFKEKQPEPNLKHVVTVVFIKCDKTGENNAFVGDYFQLWINIHLVLWWMFTTVKECNSVTHWCVFNSWHRGLSYGRLWQQLWDMLVGFGLFIVNVDTKKKGGILPYFFFPFRL